MQRLKTRTQFQAVLAGRIVLKTAHFSLHQLALDPVDCHPEFNHSPGSWLGAMTPKRWARRAVTRNMIRRQIYTVVPQLQLPIAAYLIRLRAEFSKKQFASATSPALKSEVRQELEALLASAAAGGQATTSALRHQPLKQGASNQAIV